MIQLDWVGAPARKPFKDIRNTNPTVAEQKAKLCLQIGGLCAVIPSEIKNGGSVNSVRRWKFCRDAALKVAGNKRSSITELEIALKTITNWNK